MLHRAGSWLLPAFMPLALLLVLLLGSAGAAQGPAIERFADAGAANHPLHRHDQAVSGWTQWTDEEDDPDRIDCASAIATWDPVASSDRPARASAVLRGTHSACAPLPRGPPLG
jgi:hypothetical protein